jgi:oxalate decarboxylase/phosphoglucose isomerase-like protein (cupin superfamily)
VVFLPVGIRSAPIDIRTDFCSSEGTARITLFASSGNARTFNYQPGDIGYIPASFGHYVENIGNTTLKFLEIFKTGS